MLGSMKDFMLLGIRFPSGGRIDLARMSESLRLNDSWIGYVHGRWVERMADRYSEHAEQLQRILKSITTTRRYIPVFNFHSRIITMVKIFLSVFLSGSQDFTVL